MSRMRSNLVSVDVRGLSFEAMIEALDLREYRKVPAGFYDPQTDTWHKLPNRAHVLDPDGMTVSDDPVSADYFLHQSQDLLRMIQQYGEESGLQLNRITKTRATILAEYSLPRESEQGIIKVGDIVRAGMTLSTGFDGKTPTSVASMFERLVCLNGARALHDAAKFELRHSAALTDEVLKQAGSAVEKLLSATGAYTGWIRRMSQISISPAQARAFLRMFSVVTTKLRDDAGRLGAKERTLSFHALEPAWNELVKEESNPVDWGNRKDAPFAQNDTFRAMAYNYVSAPGAEPNTLAGVYHAVTRYFNSAGGSPQASRYSVLQDSAAQRIQAASMILDSYTTEVTA